MSDLSVYLFNARCTALHNAAGKGQVDIVRQLVEAGSDINARLISLKYL